MEPRPNDTVSSAVGWLPVVAIAVAALLWLTPWHATLSRAAIDAQLGWLPRAQPRDDVLVLDIDEQSLSELGPWVGDWPFKRDVYAAVIEHLRGLGARAIALDIVFNEDRTGDAELARSLRRQGAPVVLAASALREAVAAESPARASLRRLTIGLTDGEPAARWAEWLLPDEPLLAAAREAGSLGVISALLDDDGRLRRLPVLHTVAGRALPSMPVALHMALARSGAPLVYRPELHQFDLGAHHWPVDGDGMLLLDVGRTTQAVPVLPFAAVARAALGLPAADVTLRERVGGRIIFIGSSAFRGDAVQTIDGRRSATAVLAGVYSALASDDTLRPAQLPVQLLLIALALVPSLMMWRRGHPQARVHTLYALGAGLAILATSQAVLALHRTQSDVVLPLAVVLAGWLLSAWLDLRRLREANRRMADERAVAETATRAKSDFLANVSHEMRTPMNAVLGVADILAETPLSTEQRRHVDVLRRAGNTLALLINDLLDMSKIEAGRLELDPQPFALEALLDEQFAMLEIRAQEKGVRLVRHVDLDVPAYVVGDRERLAQVLTNLLDNALKFTSQGAVELTVSRTGEPELLRFSVRDSGIGIAADKLDEIFSPFVQADGSVTRTYGGTGLGLTIARELAELMGGNVTVDSAPGVGSTFHFTVRLPAAERPPVAEGEVTTAATPVGASALPAARVLLAEDNPTNVYIIEAMLGSLGCTVDVAGDGREAVRKFRTGAYDLVLMDVQMPELDGLAATREIRQMEIEEGRAHTPIVALTAHASESDRQRSLDAGCDAHLTKPIAKATLLEAVARFVPVR
jgi:signal transduction histidine kinase/ActR/RegA family two-component response regulator